MLKQETLKQSVLKADENESHKITEQLLQTTYPNGKPIFRKKETETGWKLYCPMEAKDGKKCWCKCFEFKKTEIGNEIFWDDRIVDIKA